MTGFTKIERAQAQSDLATARVQGMKISAMLRQPTAAPAGFPYPHRTCAEWTRVEGRPGKARKRPADYQPLSDEMTDRQRRSDARKGSASLRDAIRRCG